MDTKNIVNKWEKTGLLNDVISKEALALTLENTAQNLLVVSIAFKEKMNPVVAMTIPIIRNLLCNKNFTFNESNDFVRETINVSIPHNEDEEPIACELTTNKLLQKISKYEKLNIHGVQAIPENNGFTLEIRCS